MNFSIDNWMELYRRGVESCFGGRIWFLGIQGSYGRGEATEDSDIDVVLILDQVSPEDLREYRCLLDTLPNREKICGFVSGKEELLCWEPSDLFQFCYDTTPVTGSLEPLFERISREDVIRAVRIGACNVYHMCAHNLVHEKSGDILKGLYKSATFTLQAIGFLETGSYQKRKERLGASLPESDRRLLETGMELKGREQVSGEEFDRLSGMLLSWASGWIRRTM